MKRVFLSYLLIAALVTCMSGLFAHDHKVHDRTPQNIGKVLVFGGTGWYRHPETAAINGWLSRLSDELKMQVDVTESAKDISSILSRYQVLILNNSNQLTKILDQKQRKMIEEWYNNGGGIVALHAALVRQTEWPWLSNLGGCDFDSDSEYLEAKVLVDPKAKNHPTVKGHGMSFVYTADWTNHTESVTGKPGFQVLAPSGRVNIRTCQEVFSGSRRQGNGQRSSHRVDQYP